MARLPSDNLPPVHNFSDWLLTQLFHAFLEARKGKCRSEDEYVFEMNALENLVNLRDCILAKNYKPSRGIAFIIHEPVMREIFAAPFRDRVVHHFLYNMTADWQDKRFSPDSYSCRLNKGTLYGIKRMSYHMRSVSNNCQIETTVAKFDLRGFFMSIDRRKLYTRIASGLDKQYCNESDRSLRDLLYYLWAEVVFDDPTENVRIRGSLLDWDDLPPEKSLFTQPPGQGLVIGNLTSQLSSNIYLDPFDRFLRFELGYMHSGRYVDDWYVVIPTEQLPKLMRDLKIIEDYLAYDIGATLHSDKVYIQDVRKGCAFLGAIVRPFSAAPGKRLRRNYYAAAVKVAEGRKGIDSVISYLGHSAHLDADTVNRKIFDFLGWRYNP